MVALVLAPLLSEADSSSDARAEFARGVQLFLVGAPARAREAFEMAHRIRPDARVMANIGACFAAEGRPIEAIRAYRRFLREADAGVPPERRAHAQREIARLRGEGGELVLARSPVSSELIVDGDVVPDGSDPWALAKGIHFVEVRADGYVPFSESIRLARGQRVRMSVALHRVRSVALENGAAGPSETGQTPIGRGPLPWTGVGLASALAIAGGITGILTLDAKNEYEDPDTSLGRRAQLFESRRSLAFTTDVLLGAAVVVGAASALLFIFMGSDGQEQAASLPRRLVLRDSGAVQTGGIAWTF